MLHAASECPAVCHQVCAAYDGWMLFVNFLVNACRFRGSYFDIHAADYIHTFCEAFKVYGNVSVNVNAEVQLDGLVQKFRAAQCVGSIDPAASVTGDLHIQVTHK